jgi:Zn-dependent metalloprotease
LRVQLLRPGFVPPYVLEAIAAYAEDEATRRAAQTTLTADRTIRARRQGMRSTAQEATEPGNPQRTIRDAQHAEDASGGRVVRREGEGPTGDAATDEAYDGLGDTYRLYWEVFKRDSIDGNGLPLDGLVHYGTDYDNAFWDGERMVFGDGDGVVFNRFTIAVDVIGHELTHGVTEHEAGLEYQGQPGALNESISDVFGSLVKQYALGQSAADADWLIGAGLLADGIDGVALRSMKAPGTAYDDERLGGKDPQPADMDGYVETTDDNGGVHLNSGIPNRAFQLAATALGGNAWETAGPVWYAALLDAQLTAGASFADFARRTLAHATGDAADAVREAWTTVGVAV